MKISYKNKYPPFEYKCNICGTHGSKMWREYQTFGPKMFCVICAGKSQGVDVSGFDENGLIEGKYRKTDSIGWLVPAIPDEKGIGFWGYTCVPQEGREWWKTLPTFPK